MKQPLDREKYPIAQHLKLFDDALAELSNDYPLERYPQIIELITSDQMLDVIAARGLPVLYHHWSFGKKYIDLKRAYNENQMDLAYEIVINSNPAIAYVLVDNPLPLQVLVLAHACYGHNAFFKQNEIFKRHTHASETTAFLTQLKHDCEAAENKYGYTEVERVLDAAHSLFPYAVNQAETIRGLTPDQPLELRTNLLSFIADYGTELAHWERNLLHQLHALAQYFYPQQRTKLMNEGWACFWHYQLIHDLYAQGYLSDEFMLAFIETHTHVVYQPGFEHPAYRGLNPYVLGFEIFNDIKRICTRPTDEDKDFFPELVNTDWRKAVQFAMQHFNDESFIMQYLSPHLVRKLKLFAVENNPKHAMLTVKAIHNSSGYETIREHLSAQYVPFYSLPDIKITSVDTHTGTLCLVYQPHDHRQLSANVSPVLKHLYHLWRKPIKLIAKDKQGSVVHTVSYPLK